MKRFPLLIMLILLGILFGGCQAQQSNTQVVATTLPVYEFTSYICQGTDIQATRLITENVSCLHDYTLKVSQMRAIESAELIMISGAGLEDFLDDVLSSSHSIIDTSVGIEFLCYDEATDNHEHSHGHAYNHEHDPHIWLSPKNAKIMANNIYQGLVAKYPNHKAIFAENFAALENELDILAAYANDQLQTLNCRELITLHDGFSYLADAFELNIVHAVEEEAGSEASASELISLINIISEHQLCAIFTESNSSTSAASVIAEETGISIYTLDMAMSERSYFEAMYHNIDTLKEALK